MTPSGLRSVSSRGSAGGSTPVEDELAPVRLAEIRSPGRDLGRVRASVSPSSSEPHASAPVRSTVKRNPNLRSTRHRASAPQSPSSVPAVQGSSARLPAGLAREGLVSREGPSAESRRAVAQAPDQRDDLDDRDPVLPEEAQERVERAGASSFASSGRSHSSVRSASSGRPPRDVADDARPAKSASKAAPKDPAEPVAFTSPSSVRPADEVRRVDEVRSAKTRPVHPKSTKAARVTSPVSPSRKTAEPVRLASFTPTSEPSEDKPRSEAVRPNRPGTPPVVAPSRGRRMTLAQAPVEPEEVSLDEEEPSAEGQEFDPGPRLMNYIGFRQMADVSRIFVRMDGKARYRTVRRGSNVVLELVNTSVPVRNNTRPLDTSYFNSPVMKVQAVPSGGNTRIEVRLREQVPFRVKRIGTTIAIDFGRAG